ncbi:MAG: rhodanese-like domain-containing protein [Pseudomonadota bacterium]
MIHHLDPHGLRCRLLDGNELALFDVRGGPAFRAGHLLLAVNLSWDVLSGPDGRALADKLVPRPAARIVLYDDDGGQAERACALLREWGYQDISLLEGGIATWEEAGFEIFTGTYTINNAFAFFLEHHFAIPRMNADEVAQRLESDGKTVVIDSRPIQEFYQASIPGAIHLPVAELVYRLIDQIPDEKTDIVVHCGGKARAVLGCQALRLASIPNRVWAMEHGTMGWDLSGRCLLQGKNPALPAASVAALDWSSGLAKSFSETFRIPQISCDTLEAWRTDESRSLYMIDVRTWQEFQAGHLPGSCWVPGGELVGLTEDHIATRNARICLLDDNGARARLAALYLRQMGWRDVAVLAGGLKGRDLTASVPATQELAANAEPASLLDAERPQRIKGYETTIAQRARLFGQVLRDGTLSFRVR